MFKKFLIIFCFFVLTSCSAPGTAFLGPIFTGAKTGSISQASLSYTSGKIFDEVKKNNIFLKNKSIRLNDSFSRHDPIIQSKYPIIQSKYIVSKIYISEVFEPEPLP